MSSITVNENDIEDLNLGGEVFFFASASSSSLSSEQFVTFFVVYSVTDGKDLSSLISRIESFWIMVQNCSESLWLKRIENSSKPTMPYHPKSLKKRKDSFAFGLEALFFFSKQLSLPFSQTFEYPNRNSWLVFSEISGYASLTQKNPKSINAEIVLDST